MTVNRAARISRDIAHACHTSRSIDGLHGLFLVLRPGIHVMNDTIHTAGSLALKRHPNTMRLRHLDLQVSDVDGARQFFETYFGLHCTLPAEKTDRFLCRR